MRTLIWAIVVASLPLACGVDAPDDEKSEAAPCGNGVCESLQCETPLRCPHDCGVCIQAKGQCNLVSDTDGTCGQPCPSSCDCSETGEVCTADFGPPGGKGTCVPVACSQCTSFSKCSYTPNSAHVCETATCN